MIATAKVKLYLMLGQGGRGIPWQGYEEDFGDYGGGDGEVWSFCGLIIFGVLLLKWLKAKWDEPIYLKEEDDDD